MMENRREEGGGKIEIIKKGGSDITFVFFFINCTYYILR